MQLQVAALTPADLATQAPGESSASIAARVTEAFGRQLARQGQPNSLLAGREIDMHCQPDAPGEQLLQAAMVRLDWSARAYHRVLKLARTIADLEGVAQVEKRHVAEAIQCRRGLVTS